MSRRVGSKRNKKQKTSGSLPIPEPKLPKTPISFLNDDKETVFASIIAPISVSDFMNEYWENKPLVIQGFNEKSDKYGFSKEILSQLAAKEKLNYGNDIHACKCVDGKTKDLNKVGIRVTNKELGRLFDLGATVQFHQPQRYIDHLWCLLEKLESYFGCLVGANVYITPKCTQGLAPHYDDVEVFILQLEGSKHWRLYKAPVKHAMEYKTNLSAEEIGEPTHEFTLKPGDVLYMPRGTVHQAVAQDDLVGHSTHITISTYQRHNWSEYLSNIMPELLSNLTEKSVALRKGLPLNILSEKNLGRETIRNVLKNLSDAIDDATEAPIPKPMIHDYMVNRLPPFGFDPSILEETPDGMLPTLQSSIRLTHPDHIAFFEEKEPSLELDEEDEDDDDEIENGNSPDLGGVVLMYSTFFNQRNRHMISTTDHEDDDNLDEKPGILKLPLSNLACLEQLKATKEVPLLVKSLNMKTDEEKVHFAIALWTQHLITSS